MNRPATGLGQVGVLEANLREGRDGSHQQQGQAMLIPNQVLQSGRWLLWECTAGPTPVFLRAVGSIPSRFGLARLRLIVVDIPYQATGSRLTFP